MMFWDKLLRSGYSDLGPIEIAPTAVGIVLTDRDTGIKYLVSFNVTGGTTRLSINTDFATIQARDSVRIYDKDDGPVMMEDGQYRLMIRSGRIGVEQMTFPIGVQARNDPQPYARTKFEQKAVNMDSVDATKLHLEIPQ